MYQIVIACRDKGRSFLSFPGFISTQYSFDEIFLVSRVNFLQPVLKSSINHNVSWSSQG